MATEKGGAPTKKVRYMKQLDSGQLIAFEMMQESEQNEIVKNWKPEKVKTEKAEIIIPYLEMKDLLNQFNRLVEKKINKLRVEEVIKIKDSLTKSFGKIDEQIAANKLAEEAEKEAARLSEIKEHIAKLKSLNIDVSSIKLPTPKTTPAPKTPVQK